MVDSPAQAPVRSRGAVAFLALGLALTVPGCPREPRAGRPLGDPPGAPVRPNVVLVSIDTLRADHVNAWGYEARRTTPNLDHLANWGVLFENYITAAPWTTPAHLSLFTSLGPSTHGMTTSFLQMWGDLARGSGFFRLPAERVTLAEVLRDHGWKTGAFTAGGPLDPKLGFEQGFERYETTMYKLDDDNMGEMFDWVHESAGEPFFLFWHTFEVHSPYLQPRFVGDVLPASTAREVRDGTERIARMPLGEIWPGPSSRQRHAHVALLESQGAYTAEVCTALYDGGIRSADDWLGRLLDTLREEGIYDNTIIVVTSDHGEELADRNPQNFHNVHGHVLYDWMIRVPLVIKPAGRAREGKRVAGVVRTIDVAPTLLDLLSITDGGSTMQGASLRPLWEGGDAPPREAITEASSRTYERKSIRDDRYKYIVTIDAETVARLGRSYLPAQPKVEELYDVVADPGERRNLIPSRRDARSRANQMYARLRAAIGHTPGRVEPVQLDEATLRQLEALGYVGD